MSCYSVLALMCDQTALPDTWPHAVQGTIEGHEQSYMLDDRHEFEKSRPVLVSGNTAAMLGEGGVSHMSKHFTVSL